MMKKISFLFFAFFFFNFVLNVNASSNVCPLKDETKWEYQTSKYGIYATSDKELYDTSECCYTENEIYVCDYYNEKSQSLDGSTSDSNNTTVETVDYCEGLKSTFVIIGHLVRIAKILIPIIIIGFGMMDFFKAVVGSKDDEIKKSIKSLIFRCLAGVCIFFLPAFIDLIFSWVDGWDTNYKGQYEDCFKCIWNVGNCLK